MVKEDKAFKCMAIAESPGTDKEDTAALQPHLHGFHCPERDFVPAVSSDGWEEAVAAWTVGWHVGGLGGKGTGMAGDL